jgi:predicted GNAT family acetyltransferase
MDWHFDVQKGMYFDKKISLNGCDIFLSDIIEDGFWNYAFVPSYIDLKLVLDGIEQQFQKASRQPCIYIADAQKHPTVIQTLTERRYVPLSEESFMTYSSKQSITVKPTTLSTKRVVDEASQKDFVEVFSSAYGGEKTAEQPYGELDKTYMDALMRSFGGLYKFFHYICYEGKTPVSIATLCYVNGKGGLYNVGTVPTYRGKGYGTVATKVCIDKWLELGGDTLFLQTETESVVEKWYYKLGFNLNFVGQTYSKE